MTKGSTVATSGVQATLALPVVGRVQAAARWPRNFGDHHSALAATVLSEQVVQAVGYNSFAVFSYGARYAGCVEFVRRYLLRHPQAAVVNLGCGLDSFYDAVDNGQMRYYNVDFPDVIAKREACFGRRERETNIASDLRDHGFLTQIPADHGAIVIAAGVMYYLRVSEGKALLAALARRFPRGRLVFDHECNSWLDRSNRMLQKRGFADATMHFRLHDPRVIATWSPHITHVAVKAEWCAALAAPRDFPVWLRLLVRYNRLFECMYFVVVDFADQARES